MSRASSSLFVLALVPALGLTACSEETTERPRDGSTDRAVVQPDGSTPTPDGPAGDSVAAGPEAVTVNEDLLGVREVRFLKGRCLGRASIDADTADARAAVVAFAQAVIAPIPLDGSKPKDDEELKAFVPASGAVEGWDEDPEDTTKGPWLINTSAFDWIDGAGKPFEDNGFEAAAGDKYVKSGQPWKLSLELVRMKDPAGAEKAFSGAEWNTGAAP